MLRSLKNLLRRQIRARRWGGCYPILLPHVTLEGNRLRTPDGTVTETELPADLLKQCDGTRRLDTLTASGVRAAKFIGLHDAGHLLFWPAPLDAAFHGPARDIRTIVVSPHPDDAALSVGGSLLRNTFSAHPHAALILNCFTRVSWWRFSHSASPEQITSLRAVEERLVARLMRVHLKVLDLPEAPLRGHDFETVFRVSPDGRDEGVRAAIELEVRALAGEHPAATWLLPLTVGNHLDHRITRAAAERALAAEGVTGGRIRYYEDLPYAAEQAAAPPPGLRPQFEDISATVRSKLELNRVYWTQFPWSRIANLRTYARRIGARRRPVERLWSAGRGSAVS